MASDGTLGILEDYRSHPNLKIVSQPDHSLYDAINQGFSHATGDIGAWINADDTYEANALAEVMKTFSEHPETQWLYGKCRIVNEQGHPIRSFITHYKTLLGRRFSLGKLLCENYINQPACFWRMGLWQRVGGLDIQYQYTADYDLWLRMAHSGKTPQYLHTVLANFRRCGVSISDRHFVKQFQEELCISNPYCNRMTRWLHWFCVHRTILVYKVMQRLSV